MPRLVYPTTYSERVLEPRTGGELWDKKLLDCLEGKGWLVQSVAPPPFLLRKPFLFPANVWYLAVLWRMLKGKNALILENAYLHPWTLLAHLGLCRFRKCALVAVVYHLDFHLRPWPFRAMDRFLTRCYLKTADLILVISESTRKQVTDLVGERPIHRIFFPLEAVDSGTDVERPRRERLNVLFVGNLVPRKRLELLLPAAKACQKEVELHLVGDAELASGYVAALKEKVSLLGLHNVKFHGRVPGGRLKDFYRDADLFILPSRWEGLGLVLLEAMLWRLPVMAAPVGAVPELVEHGKNGLLVDPEETGEMVRWFKTLLARPEEIRRMGEEGRKVALAYVERSGGFCGKLDTCFRQLMERGLRNGRA